jgi:hypothetical protein
MGNATLSGGLEPESSLKPEFLSLYNKLFCIDCAACRTVQQRRQSRPAITRQNVREHPCQRLRKGLWKRAVAGDHHLSSSLGTWRRTHNVEQLAILRADICTDIQLKT